jgi:hypothetical protein
MPDGRVGQLFLLGQCACGKNWDEKFKDLDLEELGYWLRPPTHCPPVRCFCVPYHIGNATKLEDVSVKAGLPMDRARIALFAEANPEFIERNAITPYGELVELIVKAALSPKPEKRRKRTL